MEVRLMAFGLRLAMPAAAVVLLLIALAFPLGTATEGAPVGWIGALPLATWALLLLAALWAALLSARAWAPKWAAESRATFGLLGLCLAAALGTATLAPATGAAAPDTGFWFALAALLLLALISVRRCAALDGARWYGSLTAALAGLWVLLFWQVGVTAFDVPRVLLPAPGTILQSMADQAGVLAGDFVQTVLKSVVTGWVLGSALGFAVGVAIDRLPFLQRGLLPLAALTSTVPLVAVAPIMVMWFGFDWPSKAAVVVLMTFFPMLISTLAGLQSAGRIERELMQSYAAGYRRTLFDLRLPCAVPYVVSALKINATLALIGAIVAEFFGSPTVGLGFRISTEAARMNMSLVWGAIVVAAVTGSAAYAALVRLERRWAFWHPSVRSK
jgi:NitT/TauT family transport system permease protein